MPVVATVSEAAGVGHVLAADAVVVDADTIGVGVQWSETSNSDDFAKNLIRARCEGRFWHIHSDPEPVRRYQGQGSTAETQELGLILEWM